VASREPAAWAHLRLMLTLAEDAGPQAALVLLPEVRKNIVQLGDRQAMAALHIFLAEIETKRGLFDSVKRHLAIGRAHLESEPNLWLDGFASIADLCLAYLESDLREVKRHARQALDKAAASGHRVTTMAALSNLGHGLIAEGAYPAAETCLRRALSLCPRGGGAESAVLDGLAQVRLSSGDLSGCGSILSQIDRNTSGLGRDSYYHLWTNVTRGRLALRLGNPQGAVALLRRAVRALGNKTLPTLSTSLRLLYAEALVADGQHAAAAEIIGAVASGCDGGSIEAIADVARVTGRALAATPGGDGGAAYFERAGRILAAVGNRTGRTELMNAYGDAIGPRVGAASPAATPAPRLDSLPRPPRRVTERLDTGTRLLPSSASPEATAASRAAAVLESGAYPEVLGREVIALLHETGAIAAGVLAARREGQPPDVIAWWGCSWPDARAMAASPPRTLDLGPWQGRRFAIAVQPPAEIGPLATLLAVEKLARTARWLEQARRDERERAALWPIEAGSDATDAVFLNEEMTGILASARKVAPTPVTVLLTGETGTGKEVVARVIHAASPRADRPFVPFNCTAVPRDMIDSQLFGYRRGAFTGAIADFPGVIRAASGGTLFLDEIGELALDVQPKLLRFLESGEVQTLGDPRPQRIADVRVVAATNASLDELVAQGRFRNDLFYRLNVVRLRIPPLRERREEIPPLAERFLQKAAREFKKGSLRLAEETIEYLVLYKWPGNVRQLANEMHRMAAMAEAGAVLMPEHLDPQIAASRRTIPASERQLAATEVVVRLDQPLAAAIEHVERAMLQHAASASGGRLEDAARELGLSRKGLYLKRQRLGLDRL
jgi:DNA-binding NtrC family response regulator/tetratricopeptide (TPR) repeat protein